MYALLGPIFFETLTSPEAFRSKTDYHFAEHQVVEAAPRLQWIFDELETISLDLHFNYKYSNPYLQMVLLRATAEAHLPLPLAFGNGVFRGFFVIESVEETLKYQADDGSYMDVEARVELREWIPGSDFDPFAPAQSASPATGLLFQTATNIIGG